MSQSIMTKILSEQALLSASFPRTLEEIRASSLAQDSILSADLVIPDPAEAPLPKGLSHFWQSLVALDTAPAALMSHLLAPGERTASKSVGSVFKSFEPVIGGFDPVVKAGAAPHGGATIAKGLSPAGSDPATAAFGPLALGETWTGGPDGEYKVGGAGNDIFDGAQGNDTLDGGAGNDRLSGGADDDLILGSTSNANNESDTLDGGTGINTLSYANSSYRITFDMSFGKVLKGGIPGLTDTASNFQKVIGTSFDDNLIGDGNNNTLDGGAGNDKLDGGGGDDLLIGGAGDDTLTGSSGIDIVSYAASTGAVTINRQAGTATGGDATGDQIDVSVEGIIGSNGDDVLTGSSAIKDVFDGGLGNDTVTDRGQFDNLKGGGGFDTLSYSLSTDAVSVDLQLGGAAAPAPHLAIQSPGSRASSAACSTTP